MEKEKVYVVYLKNTSVKLYESKSLEDIEKFIHDREKREKKQDNYEIVSKWGWNIVGR